MGVVLFFGIGLLLVTVGTIFVSLTIRHHWKEAQAQKKGQLK